MLLSTGVFSVVEPSGNTDGRSWSQKTGGYTATAAESVNGLPPETLAKTARVPGQPPGPLCHHKSFRDPWQSAKRIYPFCTPGGSVGARYALESAGVSDRSLRRYISGGRNWCRCKHSHQGEGSWVRHGIPRQGETWLVVYTSTKMEGPL